MGLEIDEVMIAPFRKLTWSGHQDSEGELRRGKESMGQKVLAVVNSVDQLPEDLMINAPVYNVASVGVQSMDCLVDVDVQRQRFGLLPKNGEIEAAIERTHFHLQELLEQLLETKGVDDCPVYFGDPGVVNDCVLPKGQAGPDALNETSIVHARESDR
jgi:hypothetical protein